MVAHRSEKRCIYTKWNNRGTISHKKTCPPVTCSAAKLETEMYDNEYAFEVIERNRREELNCKLEKMARYNSFPVAGKSRGRLRKGLSMILLSARNLFVE